MSEQIATTSEKQKRALYGDFTWVAETGLTMAHVQKYKLCKARICSSTKAKDESLTLSRDEIVAGMGALRLAALQRISYVDIDHHKTLPKEYAKKWGNKITAPYPVGVVVDTQHVDHDGTTYGEAVFSVTNQHVYKMIQEGKFKGCSIDIQFRKMDCENKDCETEGGSVRGFTLVLDESPLLDGTWVAPLEEDDLAHLEHKPNTKLNAGLQTLIGDIESAQKYLTEDGKWKDAKSLATFLITRKEIAKATAAKIAEYVEKNPNEITTEQLIQLDPVALLGWWKPHQEAHAARLFGLDQIGYSDTAPEGKSCTNCRFFSAENADDPNGAGACIFTNDSVMATGGCEKRYEVMPGKEEEAEPEQEEEEEMPEEEMAKKKEDMATKTETQATKTETPTPKKSVARNATVARSASIPDAIASVDESIKEVVGQMAQLNNLHGKAALAAQPTYEMLKRRLNNLRHSKKNLNLTIPKKA